jgi:hypothetical protein
MVFFRKINERENAVHTDELMLTEADLTGMLLFFFATCFSPLLHIVVIELEAT